MLARYMALDIGTNFCIGWCSKTLDGGGKNQLDDLEIATERACMQRAPSDDKERC